MCLTRPRAQRRPETTRDAPAWGSAAGNGRRDALATAEKASLFHRVARCKALACNGIFEWFRLMEKYTKVP